MAMMAKMRSLAPAFIITVGALFVLFMVISDSNVLEVMGARTNNVGSINGVDITYQEFMEAVEQQREMRRNQTGNDYEDEEMDQVREQVWDALLSQIIFKEEIEKLGVTITDDEIKDAILGPHPPDFLKQNFIDSLGNFDRQMYENALFDPQNRQVLVQAEEYVRQMKLNEKLQSKLFASITVSDEEIKRKFIDQNMTAHVEYIFMDVANIDDAAVTVTDDDLKDYYQKNLDKYQIKPQRKVKYVMFRNQPSEDDTTFVVRTLENIKTKIGNEVEQFAGDVEIYSTQPYSRDTVQITELQAEAVDVILNASPGTLVGPVGLFEGYVLYHLVSSIGGGELVVRASHILINDQESEEKNFEKANQIYEEIRTGASFEELAQIHSNDPGTQSKGGDLGWFGRNMMVKEFEDAAFSGAVGVVQKPIKTTFGVHLVKSTGRSDRRFVIEKIVIPVKQSASSRDAIFSAANDFSYLAQKNGFEKEAEIMHYEVAESPPFQVDAGAIPGIGMNKRMVEFAFDNGLNTVSPPFKTPQGYAVFKISEVIKEGVKPFDEVKELIRPAVVREKKFEVSKKMMEDIAKKIGGDLSKAKELEPKITYATTGSFNTNGNVPAVGRDFIFTNKALNTDVNKVSEPFRGLRGYFMIKVLERSPYDETAFQLQRNTIRDNILQEKKSAFFNQWLTQRKKDAKIVDNRYLFFGQ